MHRLVLIALLSLVLVLGGVLALLGTRGGGRVVCGRIENLVTSAVEGGATIERCELRPFSLTATLGGIVVESEELGFSASAAELHVALGSIRAIFGASLGGVEVIRPVIVVRRSERSDREGGGGADERSGPPIEVRLDEVLGRLGSLTVSEGSLDLQVGDGTSVRASDVTLKMSRKGRRTSLLEIAAKEIDFEVLGFADRLDGLDGVLSLDPAEPLVSVEMLELRVGESSVSVAGTLAGEISSEGELDATVSASLSIPELLSLGEDGRADAVALGEIEIAASVLGSPSSPSAKVGARVREAKFGDQTLGDVDLELVIDREGIDVELARFFVLGGPLDVRGRIDLDEGLPTELRVEGGGLSLANLILAVGSRSSWVGAKLAPSGSLTGTLHPLSLRGPVRTPVHDFVLLTRCTSLGPPLEGEALLDFSDVMVDATVDFDSRAIRVTDATVSQGDSKLLVKGVFHLDGQAGMDLAVAIRSLVLDPLGEVVGVRYGGLARGDLTLSGPYGEPVILADLETEDFVVADIRAGRGSGRFVYRDLVVSLEDMRGVVGRSAYDIQRFAVNLGAQPEPSMELVISTGRAYLEDVLDVLRDFDERVAYFAGATGVAGGEVAVRGPLNELGLDLRVTAREGTLLGQAFRQATFRGGFAGFERLELDELVIEPEAGGELLVRGVGRVDGPIAFSLSARDLQSAGTIFPDSTGLSGLVSGDMVIEGTFDEPDGRGAVVMLDTRMAETPIPPTRLVLALRAGRLHVTGHLVEDAVSGAGWIDLFDDRAFSVDLSIDEDDLRRWFPSGDVAGSAPLEWNAGVRGRALLRGAAMDASAMRGKLTLSSLEALIGGARVSSRAPVEVSIDRGGLVLTEAALLLDDSLVTLSGARGADGELDLAAGGTIALDALDRLLPAVTHSAGTFSFEANVQGTAAEPVLLGAGRLDGGELALEGAPVRLTALEGPIVFSQNRLIVDRLSGMLGSGRVDLEGEVELRRLVPRDVQLLANLDGVRLRLTDDMDATVAGRLSLFGPTGDLMLLGEIDVLRGSWRGDMEVDQLLAQARRGPTGAGPRQEREPMLGLDVSVSAPGTLRLDSRVARGTLAADLRITGTDAAVAVTGHVSVVEASGRFRGNDYTVSRGVVQLLDPLPERFAFDVLAETEVRSYRVMVHAFGTPSEPRLSISSEPPLPETDLVALVTMGLTMQDTEALDDAAAAAAAADALFAMSGLDRHVREFIPDNPVLRDPSFRLTSGYSVRTGQVSPRLAFESNVFVDSLRLRYSAPIGLPGQKTQAEYRITDVLSAQAEWETEGRRSTALGNLGIDFKLRWERD